MDTMDWPTRERKGRNAAGVGSRPRLRRDGLWCIHLSCGSAVDEQGKALRVRRSVYGRTTEEAERKAAALRAALADEVSDPRPEVTVAEVLDRWLARKRSCAPGTYASYAQQVRRYLAPTLGQVPLTALTADDVQDFIDRLAARSSARGTPFAAGTVRLALVVLRQALRYAVARGLVARNVAADARPPRGPARRPRFLSTAEAARLLAAHTATAMRRSTASPLSWGCGRANSSGCAGRTWISTAVGSPSASNSSGTRPTRVREGRRN